MNEELTATDDTELPPTPPAPAPRRRLSGAARRRQEWRRLIVRQLRQPVEQREAPPAGRVPRGRQGVVRARPHGSTGVSMLTPDDLWTPVEEHADGRSHSYLSVWDYGRSELPVRWYVSYDGLLCYHDARTVTEGMRMAEAAAVEWEAQVTARQGVEPN